jgi:hypothetical protein
MKELKSVYIEWYDSRVVGEGWQSVSDITFISPELILCRTLGYQVDKNKEFIIICHTYVSYEDDKVTIGLLQIPMKCVKSIKVISCI